MDPGVESSSRLIDSATVRSRPIPARRSSVDQAWRNEPRRVGEARSEIASTPDTRSGSGSSLRSSLAPTSPSSEPSSEASTSVLVVARPSSTRASSIRAAVSPPLPVASGTTAASRFATITICRRERPARRPITFTRLSSAWLKR